ncbi:MAG TPA: nucleotide exchange factor GrpE [Gaiellaceae bacterium]|nr:nucleotide exchange factor GrpE [Gaiellaceae bacterium]
MTEKRTQRKEAPRRGASTDPERQPGQAEQVDASAVAADVEAVEHDVDQLVARLEQAEAKRDEYLRDLQRLAADFDNYRKRALRDQEALVARAHERLVKELLPVLDDLERALDAAEVHDEKSVVEGVRLVQQALRAALEKEGLAEIEADGAFDPHVHEALLAQPGEGAEPGSVLQVVQKGYRLGDRVLRPARVVVAE